MKSRTASAIAPSSYSCAARAKLGAAAMTQTAVHSRKRRRMVGMDVPPAGGSRPFAGDDLVPLALADAAERVVLAERVVAEAVPAQDAAEVGVAGEDDAVHVVDLALHPLGAGPDAGDGVDLEAGVA